MKKILAVFVSLLMIFIFASCEQAEIAESNISIESSEEVLSDSSDTTSNTTEKKLAWFYLPTIKGESFVKVSMEYDNTIDGLIAKLVELRALPTETSVLSFTMWDDTATIDLSKEFGAAMIGTTKEFNLITSLVNTVTECYDIDSLNFTVDGKICNTGHNIYNAPIPYLRNTDINGVNTNFYLPNKTNDGFVVVNSKCDGMVDELVEKLVNLGVLPYGTVVNNFVIGQYDISLDLSQEFVDALSSAGTAGEIILVGALVNTISDRFGRDDVRFTVEGNIVETGHAKYDDPIAFSDNIVEESGETAYFYIPNVDSSIYDIVSAKYDGTIDGLINRLVDFKALPDGVKVYSFEINDDIATIDLSKEYSDVMIGSTAEYMVTLALVNTIIDCYDVDSVNIKVDGSLFEVAHPGPVNPIPFFSNSDTILTLFYLPNNSCDGFCTARSTYDSTIAGLINKLVILGALPEGTTVISFDINEKNATIDFQKEFSLGLNSGTANEQMIIGSLVNTIIDCYNVETVYFTVNGEVVETGHARYDSPISFVSPSSTNESK